MRDHDASPIYRVGSDRGGTTTWRVSEVVVDRGIQILPRIGGVWAS
jgi:hypothetical protein